MFSIFITFSFSFLLRKTTYIGNYSYTNQNDLYFSYHLNSTFCPNCSSLSLSLKEPIPNQTIALKNTLYGFIPSNQSFFYLGFIDQNITFDDTIQIINESMQELNLTGKFEYQQIIHYISSRYPRTFFLTFNVKEDKNLILSFYTKNKANGFLIFENNTINFTSNELDEQQLFSELKIFNEVIFSFSISATFFWFYLIYTRKMKIDLGEISLISLQMHSSFESCLVFILKKVSESYLLLDNYYEIPILILLARSWLTSLCIGYYMKIKTNVKYIAVLILIFCLISIFYALIYFTHSYLYVSLLYSLSIPQIILSFIKNKKKKKNIFFLNSMIILKLIPLFYFTCHKNNILSLYSPKFFIWISFYIILQIVVVALQSIYGGNLIILKSKFVVVPYNFDKNKGIDCPICFEKIKDDDDKIVTPCLHCFHRNCLETWMAQKMICPVCRSDISILS